MINRWRYLCLLLLCSCAAPPQNVNVTLPSESQSQGQLTVNWVYRIEKLASSLRPSVFGDTVCVMNSAGDTLLLRVSDGAQALPPFQVSAGDSAITGAVGCNDKVVSAVNEIGIIKTYDVNGDMLWDKNIRARVTSPPLVTSDNVYVQDHNGRISAYSTRRGKLLWNYVLPPKTSLRAPLDASPVLSGDLLYAGISDGIIVALRPNNGALAWQVKMSFASGVNSIANILNVTTPVVDGDIVCAAVYQGHIGCINAKTGRMLWRAPLSATRRVSVDGKNERVFGVNVEGDIYAYSQQSGELLWNQPLQSALALAALRDGVIVGLKNNILAALSSFNGEVMAVEGIEGNVTHLVSLDDKTALGATDAGIIFHVSFTL